MFYGLLIRSLTICNHQSDFQNAVIHYAQGLIARGFPAAPLRKSWHRFLQAKIPAHERPALNTFFHTWLRSQTFAPTALDDNAVADARQRDTQSKTLRTLMCGKVALNHILRILGRPLLTDTELDAVAAEKAAHERALLYTNTPSRVLDLQADPRGNYSVEVLLELLQNRSGEPVTRLDYVGQLRTQDTLPIHHKLLLVGSGSHWQAVLWEDSRWLILEGGRRFPIANFSRFLRQKQTHGAVYLIGEPNGTQLHWEDSAERQGKRVGFAGDPPGQDDDLQLAGARPKRARRTATDHSFRIATSAPRASAEAPRHPLPPELHLQQFDFVYPAADVAPQSSAQSSSQPRDSGDPSGHHLPYVPVRSVGDDELASFLADMARGPVGRCEHGPADASPPLSPSVIPEPDEVCSPALNTRSKSRLP